MKTRLLSLSRWILTATLIGLFAARAGAESMPDRTAQQRGEDKIRQLNDGRPQQTLDQLRETFPFLADATAGYALGKVWTRDGLDDQTRQIATVAAFAAMGHLRYMKIHAGYALNVGVSEAKLKEIVYLTTVHAGFPRALDAARVLNELFEERRQDAAANETS